MFRSAALILSGNALSSIFLLARNLIVARLIPIEDYGIAATFAIAMAVVEMMSALGLQQQIVQAREGDDPRFQAALQGFQVLRGVVAGVVLAYLAGPIANFMGVPQAAWAYRVIALVPVLNALVHFDIYRLNRQMVFLPMMLTRALPALISALSLWPLSMGFGDYRVMLYAMIVQAVLTVIASHLLARQPYRLLLDRAIMAGSLRYGWPILVNGALLFAIYNGDKVIVGHELGMATLAIFAMGFTLTNTPLFVLERTTQSFFLPQLSSLINQGESGWVRYQAVAIAVVQLRISFGIAMILGVALFGTIFVDVLLGSKYAALIDLLPWLGIMQATRSIKDATSVMCLAQAQTENSMYASLPRVFALLPAYYAAVRTGDIVLVMKILIVAEMTGFTLTLWLTKYRLRLPLRPLFVPVLMMFGMSVVTVYDVSLGSDSELLSTFAKVVLIVLGVSGILWMSNFWWYIRQRK